MALGGFGDTKESDILKAIFKGTSLTALTTLWIGAHTGDPGENGANNEVTGNAYARVSFDADTTGGGDVRWEALDAGGPAGQTRVRNKLAILFPIATPAGWGVITYWSIWIHATSTAAANFVCGGTITGGSVTISAENRLEFAIDDLQYYID